MENYNSDNGANECTSPSSQSTTPMIAGLTEDPNCLDMAFLESLFYSEIAGSSTSFDIDGTTVDISNNEDAPCENSIPSTASLPVATSNNDQQVFVGSAGNAGSAGPVSMSAEVQNPLKALDSNINIQSTVGESTNLPTLPSYPSQENGVTKHMSSSQGNQQIMNNNLGVNGVVTVGSTIKAEPVPSPLQVSYINGSASNIAQSPYTSQFVGESLQNGSLQNTSQHNNLVMNPQKPNGPVITNNNGAVTQNSTKQWSQIPTSVPTNVLTINGNGGTLVNNHQAASQLSPAFSNTPVSPSYQKGRGIRTSYHQLLQQQQQQQQPNIVTKNNNSHHPTTNGIPSIDANNNNTLTQQTQVLSTVSPIIPPSQPTVVSTPAQIPNTMQMNHVAMTSHSNGAVIPTTTPQVVPTPLATPVATPQQQQVQSVQPPPTPSTQPQTVSISQQNAVQLFTTLASRLGVALPSDILSNLQQGIPIASNGLPKLDQAPSSSSSSSQATVATPTITAQPNATPTFITEQKHAQNLQQKIKTEPTENLKDPNQTTTTQTQSPKAVVETNKEPEITSSPPVPPPPLVQQLRDAADAAIACKLGKKRSFEEIQSDYKSSMKASGNPSNSSSTTVTTTTLTAHPASSDGKLMGASEAPSRTTTTTISSATTTTSSATTTTISHKRKKKKLRMDDIDLKLKQLKEENVMLRRHLDNVTNKAARFENERIQMEKRMKDLVYPLQPDAPLPVTTIPLSAGNHQQLQEQMSIGTQQGGKGRELKETLNQFVETYSDYGKHREEELHLHLSQLEQLAVPSTLMKMSLWTLGQEESFFTKPQNNPIAGILRKELGITPTQGRKIIAQREKFQRISKNIEQCTELISQLKAVCEHKQKVFNDRMKKCQEILTPQQVVKLLVWVDQYSNVLESVCPGWGSERIRSGGQQQQASKDVSEDTSKDASQDTSKNVSKDTSEEDMKDAKNDATVKKEE